MGCTAIRKWVSVCLCVVGEGHTRCDQSWPSSKQNSIWDPKSWRRTSRWGRGIYYFYRRHLSTMNMLRGDVTGVYLWCLRSKNLQQSLIGGEEAVGVEKGLHYPLGWVWGCWRRVYIRCVLSRRHNTPAGWRFGRNRRAGEAAGASHQLQGRRTLAGGPVQTSPRPANRATPTFPQASGRADSRQNCSQARVREGGSEGAGARHPRPKLGAR